MPSNVPTVVEYVINRLADLGIDRVFGVPGDYAFPFDDAIEKCDRLGWVACANELNAAYAADGYARVYGASILSTTYGVGELSALNGVMGSKSQRLPVFFLVGSPSTQIQRQGLVTHHTLGDGVFNNFQAISAFACCVSTNLTPDNVIDEMERVIRDALRFSQPAYIIVPMDYAVMPINGTPIKGLPLATVKRAKSDPASLEAAINFVMGKVNAAKNIVALASNLISSYGLTKQFTDFLDKSNIAFAATPMGKGVTSESHPNYLGIYSGATSSPKDLKTVIESADLVFDVGGLIPEDINTGYWTNNLNPEKTIVLGDHFVKLGGTIFTGVGLEDVLIGIIQRIKPVAKLATSERPSLLPMTGNSADPTTSANFYPRLQRMLRAGDVLVAETGNCMLYLTPMLLPESVGFQTQALWGSIGWATPATEGICMANKGGRTILVTGDGSHQLTANEIGTMGRYGIKPIIFVLNNALYGIEVVVSETGWKYDDLAKWNYSQLPSVMGCSNWFCVKVSTVAELDAAIEKSNSFDGASYIEVMIPASESQPVPVQLQNHVYKTNIPA
ncbi:alpha-keto acid decarboxylase family protein [Orrella sp. NBD-18]|uniref:Alpha-keto acid decarboxylase family protein n=1 Tax=Sheuella amnicola TaxID=2707330 RepID=A0A6B2RB11_9BURK|nr:thiamine pyrophosphate-binding protein [Sheuella amnicola]NDY84465.1 alpha-keto acid decarboxylase family protein [Sheuella amnicola]